MEEASVHCLAEADGDDERDEVVDGAISSFGGLIRDLFRRDRVVTDVRRELYPEIAAA